MCERCVSGTRAAPERPTRGASSLTTAQAERSQGSTCNGHVASKALPGPSGGGSGTSAPKFGGLVSHGAGGTRFLVELRARGEAPRAHVPPNVVRAPLRTLGPSLSDPRHRPSLELPQSWPPGATQHLRGKSRAIFRRASQEQMSPERLGGLSEARSPMSSGLWHRKRWCWWSHVPLASPQPSRPYARPLHR